MWEAFANYQNVACFCEFYKPIAEIKESGRNYSVRMMKNLQQLIFLIMYLLSHHLYLLHDIQFSLPCILPLFNAMSLPSILTHFDYWRVNSDK